MRLGKQKQPTSAMPVAHQQPIESLVASAARITNLDSSSWRAYNFDNDTWQTETWRLYDIIGELRFVANWIGSACSRVRIYVAEVDKNGRVQRETNKPKVASLADNLFGGPSHKSEALRLLGINLTIAGDAYVIGKGNDVDSDEWFVLSCNELKRYSRSGRVEYTNMFGQPETLNPERDMLIRVWTPHPRRTMWADCPTRAAIPMLWEIERLTRFVFAQIDSRLFSAGILPIPKEVSFPDEDADIPGAEGLTAALMKAGSLSLKNTEGTAAGIVPLVVEMPLEALGKIDLVQFGGELSQQALDLRAEALRRFALAMDIDPSILSGAAEANHWGAWQILEGQVKVHIEPLMTRICDALTTAYLQPALKTIKEDPDRFTFAYDTAPLTVRPERLKETHELYQSGVVGAEAVLLAGNYKLSDAPKAEEDLEKFTRELMLRDPNLFQIPAVRKIAGYTEEMLPPNTVVVPQSAGGAGPPPPPVPPTGISPTAGGPLPLETEAQNAPGGPPLTPAGAPSGITAAATVTSLNVFVVANASVLRALEVAGKRLIGNPSRNTFSVPIYEAHTRVKTNGPDHVIKLLAGAWDTLPVLVAQVDPSIDTAALQNALDHYCTILMEREKPHNPHLLREYLTRSGLL